VLSVLALNGNLSYEQLSAPKGTVPGEDPSFDGVIMNNNTYMYYRWNVRTRLWEKETVSIGLQRLYSMTIVSWNHSMSEYATIVYCYNNHAFFE
jgi:hypothetical protein